MTSNEMKVVVFISLPDAGYVPSGLLKYDHGTRTYSFGYGERYRERPDAIPIDPVRIPLSKSRPVVFSVQEGFPNVFHDASPDSWGRKILSIFSPEKPEVMHPIEIMTAIHEPLRTGGLAFGPDTSGPQSMAKWYDGPPLQKPVTDLDKMAQLIRRIEQHTDDDTLSALRDELSEPIERAMAFSCTGMGGSRPKAFYRSEDEKNWIAKFPRYGDVWNDPRIEFATMQLAGKCGINTARTKIVATKEGVDVLLVERFDRDEKGSPKHLISGFTLGNLMIEGDWKSYQHLAKSARQRGNVKSGEELFRRMAFNVICSNRDDHPRQQAFFVNRTDVKITPAYDITPAYIADKNNQYNLALKCGSDRNPRAATLENILSLTEPFGLRSKQSHEILGEMLAVAKSWRSVFEELGVSPQDISTVANRFFQAERELPALTRGVGMSR